MKIKWDDLARLKQMRIDRKLSQLRLAELAHVGITTIQRLEQEGIASTTTLRKVCNVMGIPIKFQVKGNRISDPIFDFGFIESAPENYIQDKTEDGVAEPSRRRMATIYFDALNEEGQRAALDFLKILNKVPEYWKASDSPKEETEEE